MHPGWRDVVERDVLAAMLVDNRRIEACMEILKDYTFQDQRYGLIADAIAAVRGRQELVDLVYLTEELRDRVRYEEVGTGTITRLFDGSMDPDWAESMAKTLVTAPRH